MRYQSKKDESGKDLENLANLTLPLRPAMKQADDRDVKGLDVFMNESFKNIKKEEVK